MLRRNTPNKCRQRPLAGTCFFTVTEPADLSNISAIIICLSFSGEFSPPLGAKKKYKAHNSKYV